MFKTKPRSVTEIIESFTKITEELDDRIAADQAEADKITAEMDKLETKLDETMLSKNTALTIKHNFLQLLGRK